MPLSFNSIIDYFVSNIYDEEPEKIRKSRIVIIIYYFLIAIMTVQWLSTLTMEKTNDFPFWICIIILFITLFIFKKNGSFVLTGNLVSLLLFLFLVPIMIPTGGLYSDDLLWLILGPLLSFFIAGRKSGFLWAIVLICSVGYMYWIEINSEESLLNISLINDPKYYALSLFTLFTAIVGVVFIYDFENKKLLIELQNKRDTLKTQNTELESIVQVRTKSLAESNEQLKRSNSDLEQFAYIASHDLQEPLRMVGNFVQLLEEEYADKIDDTGKTYVKFAVDGVSRMSLLIEELLQYSRVGKMEQEVRKADLNEILEVKRNDLSFLLESKNVELNVDKLPIIDCIPGLITIIFHNLITNAIKFNTNEKPTVHISAEEDETYWKFSIKDNGIGIDEKHQTKIFEVFKRLHRKEEYSGTGIGLSICKKITHYHHGDIWFESEKEEGTTFFFTVKKELKKISELTPS